MTDTDRNLLELIKLSLTNKTWTAPDGKIVPYKCASFSYNGEWAQLDDAEQGYSEWLEVSYWYSNVTLSIVRYEAEVDDEYSPREMFSMTVVRRVWKLPIWEFEKSPFEHMVGAAFAGYETPSYLRNHLLDPEYWGEDRVEPDNV